MRQTKKYKSACELATLDHQTQDELYRKLNNLGFFWNHKIQKWERNEAFADPPSDIVRVRIWAGTSQVENLAEIVEEAIQPYGLRLLEKSEPYVCRPPKQNDSRVYLTFQLVESENL